MICNSEIKKKMNIFNEMSYKLDQNAVKIKTTSYKEAKHFALK